MAKNKIIKGLDEALEMIQGKAKAGNIIVIDNPLQAKYDFKNDVLTVVDLEAEKKVDNEIKETNEFKGLTLYHEQFSWLPVKLEIVKFTEDNWHRNEDLTVYVIMNHFDSTEKPVRNVFTRLLNCGVGRINQID